MDAAQEALHSFRDTTRSQLKSLIDALAFPGATFPELPVIHDGDAFAALNPFGARWPSAARVACSQSARAADQLSPARSLKGGHQQQRRAQGGPQLPGQRRDRRRSGDQLHAHADHGRQPELWCGASHGHAAAACMQAL